MSKFQILECKSSSVVERHVEAVRVGGSIPSFCTIFSAGDQGERGSLLNCIQAGSIPAPGANYGVWVSG